MTSPSLISPTLLKVFKALLVTSRASGSAMVEKLAFKAGNNLSMKGATTCGSSTNLHMLSTITAALRLIAVSRSAKPLDNNGAMMDKVAMVTSETKVVAPKMWTVSGTSVGLAIHSINLGINFSISLLSMVSVDLVMVLVAASLTSFLVSHIASDKTGINSGILKATWALAVSTNWERDLKIAIFSVHLLVLAKLSNKAGNKALTAVGVIA
mmetsp:Transcript_8019/g.7960  ORF Transcript_8019/g.7960 Transcript_8019/m.7960 type:complete len:211 (+) Transcript_8019:2278-2910(+)